MEKQELKVAVLTTQQRDMRVIGIVLTHIKSSQYTFTLAERSAEAKVDVVIVDHGDPAMLEWLQALMARNPRLQAIHLVHEPGKSGARYEILPNQLMMQLLPMLERIVKTRVPVANKPAAVAKVAAATAQPAANEPVQLRALVVDDSQTVRAQLASVMTKIGMACDIADGARAALNQLSRQRYDVIYVDVMMPDMDGYALTREIKRDRSNKAPVIILTSQSSPFDRARGALAGCDIYLTKPVGLKQFYAATTKALRKSMAVDDLSGWIKDPTVAPVPAHA